MNIPEGTAEVIAALERGGFEAYVVGGCVRDSLCGRTPHDWDICTNAKPEQVKACFDSGVKIVETGIRHGTVTVLVEKEPYEVTTYRVDGAYLDNRHPSAVEFVNSLRSDLSRRDFTVNAMAYNPRVGLVDYFDGCKDLEQKQIRCVGAPNQRFGEDALRMLRALRFAAVYGFTIAEPTQCALRHCKELLRNIAVERCSSELCRLLPGRGVADILSKYADVLCVLIPELEPMRGFRQNNPYHHLDVWQHTVQSIAAAPENSVLRLTMLFHDIAKPRCYETDEQGIGHFYGHPQHSADMAEGILKRLRLDNETTAQVKELILYHDSELQPRSKHMRRWLYKIGEYRLRQLIQVQRADIMAQNPAYCANRLARLKMVEACIDNVIEQRQCFCLKDLAVNGRDLIEAGVPQGTQIGVTLNHLLGLVLNEQLENNREALLAARLREQVRCPDSPK